MNIHTIAGDPTEYSTIFHVPDEPKIITECRGCNIVSLLTDLWYGDYCCFGCYKQLQGNSMFNPIREKP